ncbi:MAG: sugar phosphate isomerase/epimerase family protein [Flavitalea sp.]
MRRLLFQSIFLVGCLALLNSCGNQPQDNEKDETAMTTTSDSLNADAGWKLGVQMWTFNRFSFTEALNKADSAGIKFIEAYPGQPLGGDLKGNFDVDISADNRSKIKTLLAEKGIRLMAFGVVGPENPADWRKLFEFAKDMGVQYITAEPKREHWDTVNTMAGEYSVMVAIHDHPKPSPYDHPDSVLNAINGRINLGACADVGHWTRNGLDAVQCLKTLEGRILGLHLKDIASPTVEAGDVILGTGVVKLPEVFAELKRQQFKGMFSIEHEVNWENNVPDVIKNRQYFEQYAK